MAGRIHPLCHIDLCVCVVGVSKGVGKQLERGGRELELDHNVFNLKMNLLWEWA